MDSINKEELLSYTKYSNDSRLDRVNKRILAIKKLGSICQVCGLTIISILQFHHIKLRSGKRYSSIDMYNRIIRGDKDILLLCPNCHVLIHKVLKNTKLSENEYIINLIELFKLKLEEFKSFQVIDNESITITKENFQLMQLRLQGKKWPEIEKIMGINRGTLYSRLKRLETIK